VSAPSSRLEVDWGDSLLRTWGRIPALALLASAAVALLTGALCAVGVVYCVVLVARGDGSQVGLVPVAALVALGGLVLAGRVLAAALADLREPARREEGRVVRCERLLVRGRSRFYVVIAPPAGRQLGFEVEESLWQRAGAAREVTISFTRRLRYLRSLEPRMLS
jgi:hypothetical protein